MKVAIIGAGVSGLASAFEFKRYGITPTIFEKKSHIGDPILFATATLHLFSRSSKDPLAYIKNNYGLNISPTSKLKEIIMFSPSNKTLIQGDLGYLISRMREEESLVNQISSQLSLPIEFDSFVDIDDIREDFDHIIVATGKNIITKQLDLWNDIFRTRFRSATVVGDFDSQSVSMWLNTDYAKHGFAYLIPINSQEANLNIVLNDITHHEIDYYWEKFLSAEGIDYQIIETRDSEFNCGFLETYKLDNLYFIGSSGGFTDSLLGFGQIKAIESGILAARAIMENLNYNKLVSPIAKDMEKIYELRKAFNSFDNQDLDRLIGLLKRPTIKKLIYKNRFFKAKYASSIAQIYNALEGIRKH